MVDLFSDFIEDWVKVCLPAKSKVLSEANGSPFGGQCALCEKVKKSNFSSTSYIIPPMVYSHLWKLVDHQIIYICNTIYDTPR